MLDLPQHAVIDSRPARQRLFADKPDGIAHQVHRAVNEGHDGDHRGRKIPLSSTDHGRGENDPLSTVPIRPILVRMARQSDEWRKAIRRFMAARGLRPKPWAIRAGLDPKTLANFLNGKSESLTHTSLAKLANAEGVTVGEIIGERAPRPRAVAVRGIKVSAAAGGGAEIIEEEDEAEPFYFRRSFIDRVSRGGAGNLAVIGITGDSMEPTFRNDDVVLLDMSQTNIASVSGIYCVLYGGGLVVKRVDVIPGERPKVRIRSDNKAAYDPIETDAEDVRIIGRVIWRGGMV